MPHALLVTSGRDSGVAAQLAAAHWSVREVSVADARALPPGSPVDLVVCPLHLADGRDGAALIAQLRQVCPEARALLTAEALDAGESERLARNACEVAVIRVPASSRLLALGVAAAT